MTLALASAAGVVVPLGLSIALRDGEGPRALRRALVVSAPIGAAAGVLGWRAAVAEPFAVACAGAHLFVGVLAGALAVARLWSRRRARFAPLETFAADAGMMLLPVGGAWLLASRAGVPLAGFEEPVVTFTAAHFHYAGFAAPIVLAGAGALVREGESRALCTLRRTATIVVCAGVPLTAVGIATSRVVERVAAVVLASGMLGASALLALFASRRALARSRLAAALLVASGASLLVTMALAATFALTSSAGRGSSLAFVFPLQTMIDVHGGGNAFGFAVCGVAALAVLDVSGGGGGRARS